MLATNNFRELEFKYKADAVGLQDFLNLMEKLKYKKSLDISSWDTYYTKENNDNFIRFRESAKTPELTIKRKVTTENNWDRIEVDLPLDPKRLTRQTVQEFVKLEGYKENFRIYKTCNIFWQQYVNYVYYIVYDKQKNELGRFIEVEINKEALPHFHSGQLDPEQVLRDKEKELEELGITSKNRLKKSLFELFKQA